MKYGLVFFFFLGIALTIAGYKVTFTKAGLEWMYKSGIWKKVEDNDPIFTEKGGRRFDRINGSGFLLVGIVMIVMTLITLFIKPHI